MSQESAPTMSAAEQAKLMKATEELVTKARLDQIARDHKSMGAVLDDRTLFKIEEPMKRNRSQTFKTALQLQREKELHDEALAKEAVAERILVDAAKELKKQNDYSTEQQIWKEKSGPAAYSQARRFQFPELQKFKESFTHEQHVIFKKRCNAALMALSDKYRAECREMKADMDLNGVFHPEANAHRIHCIYLMKLYKGVRSDTIEDPILRQMKAEEEARLAHERALHEQKQELLRSMEAAEFANMTPAQQEAAMAEAEAKKRAEGGETETDSDIRAPESATLDGGASVEGNTATNSVASAPSAGLSVVIPGSGAGTGVTPKHSANVTPTLNSKGNNVQFARMGSMKSVRSAGASDKSGFSERDTDSERANGPLAGSSGKFGGPGTGRTPKAASTPTRSALSRNSSYLTPTAASAGAVIAGPGDAAGISAVPGTSSSDAALEPSTTSSKQRSANRASNASRNLNKSFSTPALSSDGGEGSNPTSGGALLSASQSSSKLPPILEPGAAAPVNATAGNAEGKSG
jgi:hypothetical protein